MQTHFTGLCNWVRDCKLVPLCNCRGCTGTERRKARRILEEMDNREEEDMDYMAAEDMVCMAAEDMVCMAAEDMDCMAAEDMVYMAAEDMVYMARASSPLLASLEVRLC